ncbi:MAG: WD40/YVTN/BNR-like repeat-containing protein [Hyphomonadaceae bacterium]
MSNRLLVATRKGLFDLKNGAVTRASFLGSPVTFALRDPRDGALYASLNLGHFGVKLHRSEDDGATWTELPAPSYAGVSGDPAPSLALLWTLAPGGVDEPGALWAGTIPGGLFRSEDRGESWRLVQSLWDTPERARWFGGGYDHPGIHSICVDPRDSAVITVAVSCGGVWRSEDRGANWRLRTHGMWAAYMPPEQREDSAIQDPHCLSACAAAPDVMWVQHHNGAFVSTDAGAGWRELAVPPSSFGFAVAAHPHDPQTAWFAPALKDEFRYPVDGKVVVARTRDGGDTFEMLRAGLPQQDAYDLVYRHGLVVDETGARLAMGSTSGGLWLSDDGGDAWRAIEARLPPIYALRFA